ncbi:MAG: F0F1 ATP synthase subunit B [Phycisphaerales bacterium]|nr:F0F1 ATP synthase subunit B [Phycisphaerales bacterium]
MMKKSMLAFALFVLMTAPAAMAAGVEKVDALPTAKQGVATAATALVVFAIAAAFLGTVVWPKISKGLSDRESKIRSEIEAAEQARQQAKSALEMYQKNLAEANSKAQQMIAEAKAAQQAQLAEQRAKADTDMAMLKDKAMREIEAAKKQALAEIYAQTASLATGVAGRILQREVNGADAEKFTLEAIGSFKNN